MSTVSLVLSFDARKELWEDLLWQKKKSMNFSLGCQETKREGPSLQT